MANAFDQFDAPAAPAAAANPFDQFDASPQSSPFTMLPLNKDAAGNIFHTYSSYGRGLDILIGAYNWLDLAPKGRDEEGLQHGMAWVRHHDKYIDGQIVDPARPYSQPKSADTK